MSNDFDLSNAGGVALTHKFYLTLSNYISESKCKISYKGCSDYMIQASKLFQIVFESECTLMYAYASKEPNHVFIFTPFKRYADTPYVSLMDKSSGYHYSNFIIAAYNNGENVKIKLFTCYKDFKESEFSKHYIIICDLEDKKICRTIQALSQSIVYQQLYSHCRISISENDVDKIIRVIHSALNDFIIAISFYNNEDALEYIHLSRGLDFKFTERFMVEIHDPDEDFLDSMKFLSNFYVHELNTIWIDDDVAKEMMESQTLLENTEKPL